MNWHLPRSGGVETLAGFLLSRLGKIPTGEETVDFEGRRFTVLEMSNHRISQVRVERLDPQPAPQTDPQPDKVEKSGKTGAVSTSAVKTGVAARGPRDPGKSEG